jgi:hypothetical protein
MDLSFFVDDVQRNVAAVQGDSRSTSAGPAASQFQRARTAGEIYGNDA